jgi:hypothetical protein
MPPLATLKATNRLLGQTDTLRYFHLCEASPFPYCAQSFP